MNIERALDRVHFHLDEVNRHTYDTGIMLSSNKDESIHRHLLRARVQLKFVMRHYPRPRSVPECLRRVCRACEAYDDSFLMLPCTVAVAGRVTCCDMAACGDSFDIDDEGHLPDEVNSNDE